MTSTHARCRASTYIAERWKAHASILRILGAAPLSICAARTRRILQRRAYARWQRAPLCFICGMAVYRRILRRMT